MWRFARRRLGLLGLVAGYFFHPRHGARRRAQALSWLDRGRTVAMRGARRRMAG